MPRFCRKTSKFVGFASTKSPPQPSVERQSRTDPWYWLGVRTSSQPGGPSLSINPLDLWSGQPARPLDRSTNLNAKTGHHKGCWGGHMDVVSKQGGFQSDSMGMERQDRPMVLLVCNDSKRVPATVNLPVGLGGIMNVILATRISSKKLLLWFLMKINYICLFSARTPLSGLDDAQILLNAMEGRLPWGVIVPLKCLLAPCTVLLL